jgi:hypothetical protein
MMDMEVLAGGTNIDVQHFQAESAGMSEILHERGSGLGIYLRNGSGSDIFGDDAPDFPSD